LIREVLFEQFQEKGKMASGFRHMKRNLHGSKLKGKINLIMDGVTL
jgi:hypothetical protein